MNEDITTQSSGATTSGILSMVLASTCCVLPVVLAVAGLGGLGLGAFFGEYHWYFLALGVGALAFGWGSYLRARRACQAAQCELSGGRRTRTILAAATAVVVGFGGLSTYTYAGAGTPELAATTLAGDEVSLRVEGMTCFTCEAAVESSLTGVDGVLAADANVQSKSVTVRYDASKVEIQQLIDAVNETGFKAHL